MISVGKRNQYQAFYSYLLLVREVRESTATYYVQKVGVLLRLSPVLSATSLTDAFATLKANGAKGSYINKLREIARIYCDFLQHSGQEVDQGIYLIKKVKEGAITRATMSDSEIEAFLNLPPLTKGGTHLENYNRWTLFFSIMAYTGMRPQEIARLTTDLVDFGRGVFIVTEENSKTHTQRFVPIPPNIDGLLKSYVNGLQGEYLFPARQGHSYRFAVAVVDNVDWGYNFHCRIKRLGIKRRGLCPYSLRHSLITRLLEEDVNIFKVQKIVGHRRLETTAAYTHMTTKDIQLAITKHPLIRKATDPLQILSAFKEVVRGFEFEKNNRFTFEMRESGQGLNISIYLSNIVLPLASRIQDP